MEINIDTMLGSCCRNAPRLQLHNVAQNKFHTQEVKKSRSTVFFHHRDDQRIS